MESVMLKVALEDLYYLTEKSNIARIAFLNESNSDEEGKHNSQLANFEGYGIK